MEELDRCRGCEKRLEAWEGHGFLVGSRLIWACDRSCLKAFKRARKRRLQLKRSSKTLVSS